MVGVHDPTRGGATVLDGHVQGVDHQRGIGPGVDRPSGLLQLEEALMASDRGRGVRGSVNKWIAVHSCEPLRPFTSQAASS